MQQNFYVSIDLMDERGSYTLSYDGDAGIAYCMKNLNTRPKTSYSASEENLGFMQETSRRS